MKSICGKNKKGLPSEFCSQEPKLTRSRVRQAVASGVASGGISPEKIVSGSIILKLRIIDT